MGASVQANLLPSVSRRCAARWGLFPGGRRAWDPRPAYYGWPGACGGTIVGACSRAVIGCCIWSYWQEWQRELRWPHAEADLGEAGAVNVTSPTSAARTTAVTRAEMLWMRSARSFSAWLSQGSTFSARNFVSGSPRCATASPVGKRQEAGSIGRELAVNQNSGLEEVPSAAAVIRGVSKSGTHGIWVSGVCGNVNLDMLVDTGASTSFVSENSLRSMQNMPELSPMNNRVLCADGNDLPVTGVLNTHIQLGNRVLPVRFIVAEMDYPAILGMDALQKWNAVIDTCNWQLILDTNGKSSVSDESNTEITPRLSHSVVKSDDNFDDANSLARDVNTNENVSDHISNDNIGEASENISEASENISEANENISETNENRPISEADENISAPNFDNGNMASENISDTTRSDNNRYNTDTSMPPHHQGVDEFHDMDWFVDGYDIDAQCEPGYLVIAAEDMSVPARAVAMIDVNVRDAAACHPVEMSGDLLVERRDKFEDRTGLKVGRTLIDASQVIPVIEIMNTSDIPVLVRKGTVIGVGEIVSDFINFGLEVSNAIDNKQLITNEASDDNETEPNFLVHYGPLTEHVSELIDGIMGDLSPEVTSEDKQEIDAMLRRNIMAFQTYPEELGCTNKAVHRIDTGDSPPVRQRYRRIPLHKRPVVEAEVKRMLDQGVIEPAQSPWSSNIVLVWKPWSKKWRVCSDFRWINSLTKKDAYPLPRIDETLEMLEGAVCFVSLDLVHRYWQVPIHHDDKEKTAFYTHMGMYQFRVLPMGVCNGGATFERLMETVLRGLLGERALVYLDDIVVWGRTVGECSVNLDQVLKRLVDAGLKIRGEKCQFFKPEIEYLGHIVSKEGVSTSPSKIAAVKEWPIPKNITEVRSFHGFCSYYRSFIKDFAKIAHPLTQLMHREVPFHWSNDCQKAFEELQNALVTSPILAYPRPEGQVILDTDASEKGLGAVLSQVQDGMERVLAYASRSLRKPEKNYCVTRKELSALMFGIKKFKAYLDGRPVRVRTDHSSLQWLTNFKEPEGQVARWLEQLAPYDLHIEHRPGRKHGNADGLSSRPCKQCGIDDLEPEVSNSLEKDTHYCRAVALLPEEASELRVKQTSDEMCQEFVAGVEAGQRPPKVGAAWSGCGEA